MLCEIILAEVNKKCRWNLGILKKRRQMLDKLDFLSGKYSELNIESIDHNQWNKIMEKQSHMQPIIEKYYEYTAALTGIYETVNELITSVRRKSLSRNPKS